MDIKSLPENVRSHLRSTTNINSSIQCITELVLNSLDAKSKSIAVRVNLLKFQIQVVDNGVGLTKPNMNVIGNRFMTSKCHSLEDLKIIKSFGFRGEALASIKDVSKILTVTSRSKDVQDTYSKTWRNGKWETAQLIKQRPSQGTTVTIEGFMHNLPVRQRRINQTLDIESIRKMMETLAIIHYNVTFNLRNDVTGKTILKSSKSCSVSESLIHFYPDILDEDLLQVRVTKGKLSISGLICKKSTNNNKRQYIYLNKRSITSSKIQKVINSLLMNSTLFQKNDEKGKGKQHQKYEHPLYVINIRCPYSEVDLTLSPSKKTVEFKNWNAVSNCISKSITKILENGNYLQTNNENKNNKKTEVQECKDKSQFGVSQIKGVVKSKAFKRKIIDDIIDKPTSLVEDNVNRNDDLDVIKSKSYKSSLNEGDSIWEIDGKKNSSVEPKNCDRQKEPVKKRNFKEVELCSKIDDDSKRLKSFEDSFLQEVYNEEPKNKKQKSNEKEYKKKSNEVNKKTAKGVYKKKTAVENENLKEVIKKANDSAFNFPKFYDMELHTKKNSNTQKVDEFLDEKSISIVELDSIQEKSRSQNSIVKELERVNSKIDSPPQAALAPFILDELESQHSSIFEPVIDQNILEQQDEGKKIILNMFFKSLNQYQAHKEDDEVPNAKGRAIEQNLHDNAINRGGTRICFGKHTLNAMNMPRFGSFECFRQTNLIHNTTIITNTTKRPNLFSSEMNLNQELHFQEFRKAKNIFGTSHFANEPVFNYNYRDSVSNFVNNRFNEAPVPLYTRCNPRNNFRNFCNANFAHNEEEMPFYKRPQNFFQRQAFDFCANVEKTFNSHLFNNNLKFEYLNFNNRNLYNKPIIGYNMFPSNRANPPRNAWNEFNRPIEPIRKQQKKKINREKNKQLFSPFFGKNVRKGNVFENKKRSTFVGIKNNVTSPYFKKSNKQSFPQQFVQNGKRKGSPILTHQSNTSSSVPFWHTDELIRNEILTSANFPNVQPNQDQMFGNNNYHQERFGFLPNPNNNPFKSIAGNKPSVSNDNIFQKQPVFNQQPTNNFELLNVGVSTLVRPSTFQNLVKNQTELYNQKSKQPIEENSNLKIASNLPFNVPQARNKLITFHELQKETEDTVLRNKNDQVSVFKKPNIRDRSKLALKKFSTEPFLKFGKQLETFPKQSKQRSQFFKKFTTDPILEISSTNCLFTDDLHKNFSDLNLQNANLSFTPSENLNLRLADTDDSKFEMTVGSFKSFKPQFESSGMIAENKSKHSDVVEGTLISLDNVVIPSLNNFESEVADKNVGGFFSSKKMFNSDKVDVLNNQEENGVIRNCSFLSISMDIIKEALPTRNQDGNEIMSGKRENLNGLEVENDWMELQDSFGEIFYLNKRTGMTSKSVRKEGTNFIINKRIEFVPKGFSQILTKSKEIQVSLSPKSKKALNTIILESYEDELNTIKWSNYIHENDDVQKFFEELYFEKSKQIDVEIPNGSLQQLPKSMIKMYNRLDAEYFTKDIYLDLMVIGQVDKKFIAALCKSKDLLVLFDQHAVHERVRLEYLLEDYKDNEANENSTKLKSTICQEKAIIELPKSDINILIKYENLILDIGLQFNVLQTGIEIISIPDCISNKILKFSKKDRENELKKFIDALIQEEINTILTTRGIAVKMPTVLQNIINSEACRGAIKFGDELSLEECEELIKLLFTCHLPFQCAHGRPTITPVVCLKENNVKEKTKLKFHNLK